ncbi:Pkinase-domain-containing protein [Salix suchowensis]|nr:Pkinase-domain-containing protein [Salix suchowensis]
MRKTHVCLETWKRSAQAKTRQGLVAAQALPARIPAIDLGLVGAIRFRDQLCHAHRSLSHVGIRRSQAHQTSLYRKPRRGKRRRHSSSPAQAQPFHPQTYPYVSPVTSPYPPARPTPTVDTNLPSDSISRAPAHPGLSSPSSTSSPAAESTPPRTPGTLALAAILIIMDLTETLQRESNSSPLQLFDRFAIGWLRFKYNSTITVAEKVIIVVTPDAERYFTVDISGAKDPAFIKERIFTKLSIWEEEDQKQFSMWVTEIGAYALGDALSDERLFELCRERGDSKGSLKLMVSYSSALVHEPVAQLRAPISYSPNPIPPPVLPPNFTDTAPLRPKPRSRSRQGSLSSTSDPRNGYEADLDNPDWDSHRATMRPPRHQPFAPQSTPNPPSPLTRRSNGTNTNRAVSPLPRPPSPPQDRRRPSTADVSPTYGEHSTLYQRCYPKLALNTVLWAATLSGTGQNTFDVCEPFRLRNQDPNSPRLPPPAVPPTSNFEPRYPPQGRSVGRNAANPQWPAPFKEEMGGQKAMITSGPHWKRMLKVARSVDNLKASGHPPSMRPGLGRRPEPASRLGSVGSSSNPPPLPKHHRPLPVQGSPHSNSIDFSQSHYSHFTPPCPQRVYLPPRPSRILDRSPPSVNIRTLLLFGSKHGCNPPPTPTATIRYHKTYFVPRVLFPPFVHTHLPAATEANLPPILLTDLATAPWL